MASPSLPPSQLHPCYIMSSEGPVISMQPVSTMSGSPPHIRSSMNKHLMSIPRRERSSSTSDVSSPTQQHHLLPPSPLVDPIQRSVDIQRSLSMPRGVRGLSAEPNPSKSLPASKSTDFRSALSHRMIRRAETVETTHFSKEDFEVVQVKYHSYDVSNYYSC